MLKYTLDTNSILAVAQDRPAEAEFVRALAGAHTGWHCLRCADRHFRLGAAGRRALELRHVQRCHQIVRAYATPIKQHARVARARALSVAGACGEPPTDPDAAP